MKLVNLAKKYNYTCHWCKNKFPLEELERDHIKTGQRKYRGQQLTTRGGVLLSCKQCNRDRGDLSISFYSELLKRRKKEYEETINKNFKEETRQGMV